MGGTLQALQQSEAKVLGYLGEDRLVAPPVMNSGVQLSASEHVRSCSQDLVRAMVALVSSEVRVRRTRDYRKAVRVPQRRTELLRGSPLRQVMRPSDYVALTDLKSRRSVCLAEASPNLRDD